MQKNWRTLEEAQGMTAINLLRRAIPRTHINRLSGQLGPAFPRKITGLPLEIQMCAGLGRSAAHLEFVQQVIALLPSQMCVT